MALQDLYKAREYLNKAIEELEAHEVPLTDFKVQITAPNRVQCTWKGHQEGLFDIEYYREGEAEWKHSVARYREPISILDHETTIGFNSDIEKAYFRAVVGEWTSEVVSVGVESDTVFELDMSKDNWNLLPIRNNELRVTYTPNEQGTERVSFKERIPAGDAYTLRYDVLFEPGWSFNTLGDGNKHHKDTGYPFQTGKLLGLGSINPTSGRGGVYEDQWGVRVKWHRNRYTHKPHPNHPPIDGNTQPFSYDDDVALSIGYYGQNREPGDPGSKVVSNFANIKTDMWYTIRLGVQLGEPDKSEDLLTLIIEQDGNVLGGVNVDGVNLRKKNGLIERFRFTTFFGGSTQNFAPEKTQYARFRNIKVVKGVTRYEPTPDPIPDPDDKTILIGDHQKMNPDGFTVSEMTNVIDMRDGTYRLYYTTYNFSKTDWGFRNLYFITSKDGLSFDWKKRVVCDVDQLGEDGQRLIPHFTGSTWRGVWMAPGHTIRTAISSDGKTWRPSATGNENLAVSSAKSDGLLSFVRLTHLGKYFIYGRVRGSSTGGYTQYVGSDAYPDNRHRRGITVHSSTNWRTGYDGFVLFDPAKEFEFTGKPTGNNSDPKPCRPDIHEMNAVEYIATDGTPYILGFPSCYFVDSRRNFLRSSVCGWLGRGDKDFWQGQGTAYSLAVKSTDGINFTWIGKDTQRPERSSAIVDLEPFKRVLPDPPIPFPTLSQINRTAERYKLSEPGWVRVRDVKRVGDNVHLYMDVSENTHDEAREFFTTCKSEFNTLPSADRIFYVQKMTVTEFEKTLRL